MNKVKIFEAFAGIGSCTQSLKDEGIEIEVVGISEWNIDSAISYDAIHSDQRHIDLPSYDEMRSYLEKFTWSSNGKDPLENLKRLSKKKLSQLYQAQIRTNNYGSIIDLTQKLQNNHNYIPDFDFFTHGSPCQDFSVAGSGKGGDEDSNTRSSLMWNSVEIISIKKPIRVLWENVANVLTDGHKHNYRKYLYRLEQLGYVNSGEVLNAKDYGIPQNRERVFVASTLKEHYKKFKWPKPFDNGVRLKHLLETEVDEKYYISDEKYYISDEKCAKLLSQLNGVLPNQERSYCIDANYAKGTTLEDFCNRKRRQLVGIDFTYNDPNIREVSNCISARTDRGVSNRKQEGTGVLESLKPYDCIDDTQGFDGVRLYKGECPTLRSQRNGLKIVEPLIRITEDGFHEYRDDNKKSSIQGTHVTFQDGRIHCMSVAHVPKILEPNECIMVGHIDINGHDYIKRVYSEDGCAPTIPTGSGGNHEPKVFSRFRIRRLTFRECGRLMGFSDKAIDKIVKAGISESAMYKMFGNSIVVDVLRYIWRSWLSEAEFEYEVGDQISFI